MLFMPDKFKVTLLQLRKTTTFKNQQTKRIYIRYSTTSTVSAATLYISRNAFYVLNNMQEKQKQALI